MKKQISRLSDCKATAWRGALLCACFFAMAHTLDAAVKVEASVSSQRAFVGQPVELKISVQGSQSAQVPSNFEVPGLLVQYRGQSTQFQMQNFQVSTSVVYSFVIVPEQSGTFTIPALSIGIQGRNYKTNPVTLEVEPGQPRSMPPGMPQLRHTPGYSPPPASAPVPRDISEVVYAELILPEQTAFVGQMIPVEIRLYFDRRFRFEVNQHPVFSGEGFTVEKLAEPVERQQNIDGVNFAVFTFHSAITPVKSGTLEIEPATLRCGIVVPRSRGSLFDDMFGDLFGGGMSPFGEVQEVNLTSNGATLEVKPVPRDGRPSNFTGAIGQFNLEANAAPLKASEGEPIMMTLTLVGQGNFNAVTQPELTEAEGWRVYPATDQFTPGDTVGFSGTKKFDIAMVARESKTRTPGASFSYFDPMEERFVTLQTEPLAVEVAGRAPAPAPVVDSAAAAATPNQSPAAEESPVAESEVTPLRPADRFAGSSFQPVLWRSEFLVANAAAGVAWLALLAFVALSLWKGSEAGERMRLAMEEKKWLRQLNRPGLSQKEFFELACELMTRRTGSESAEGLKDPDHIRMARLLVQRRDELKFGRVREQPQAVFDRERASALEFLHHLVSA